jgi:glycosyltransferase involved in cell wall biosynthesis
MSTPLLSVWMITYNHEPFIAQAIESVLAQKADFSFELVIGEDFSTDSTRKICLEYEQKHPSIIRVLKRPSNLGIHRNMVDTLTACHGKYIALLEGDDYWTDELKVAKQVSFLEQNEDFVLCYQKTLELNELTGAKKITNEDDRSETDMNELLERGWFIRTGSMMFRNGVVQSYPEWFYKFSSTDYMFQILLAREGRFKFLNEVTSVYRRHEGGVTQAFQKKLVSFNLRKIELLTIIDQFLKYQYHREIEIHKKDLYNATFILILQDAKSVSDILRLIRMVPSLGYGKIVRRFAGFTMRKLQRSSSTSNAKSL